MQTPRAGYPERPPVGWRRRAATGLFAVALFAGCGGGADPQAPAAGSVELDVGLTAAERDELRWLSEGSDLFPVVLLQALVDEPSGLPFTAALERFGFLPAAPSEANPLGLPVGWTTDVPELSPNRLPYVGINCSACHTGQIEYRGTRMRIDGAPNLADIEAFGLALRDSLRATLADPARTLELVKRVSRELHPEAGIAAPLLIPSDTRRFLDNLEASVKPEAAGGGEARLGHALAEALQRRLRGEDGAPADEVARALVGPGAAAEPLAHLRTTLEVAERFGPIVKDRLGFALRAVRAIEISPAAGPGRDDPWGIIRNQLFSVETPLTAPTSIPHLFHMPEVDWYHADGNTTSVVQRNVAQAVALGAYVEPASGESTLRPRQIRRIEELWAKVVSPAWPAGVFGPIDAERAARGERLFHRPLPGPGGRSWSCAECHGSRRARLVELEVAGTDPNRALSFAEPLSGRPFDRQLVEVVDAVIATALARAGVEPEEARSWEYRTPEWRTTRRYVARRLDGVWAAAPYLHNGSVPTLWDLLLPADRRPPRFPLGQREYDPERVGYVTEVARPIFVFDTAIDGNSNRGHEFGTGLDEAERADLVEYLKTL